MLTGPLDQHALSEAKRIFGLIEPKLAIHREYLHWSVEAFGCVDGQYNIVICLKDGQWTAVIAHDLKDNARQLQDGDSYAAHTYLRNSYAVGIAIDGMDGSAVDHSNFGKDGIQLHEVEVLCAVGAAVALKYGLDAAGRLSNGETIIATHAEAADWDGYFGERWDLERLVPSPDPLSPTRAHQTGDLLRERIHQYKVELMNEGLHA